jgi:arylsulfatase A-like enzyme
MRSHGWTRRKFLRAAGAITAAAAVTHRPSPASAQTARPNVILMMCDDLGYGDVGFNGNTIIKTPNLDAMAADSLKFTRFYAGGPVCSPTRATCLTGRHYYRHGIWTANAGRLAPEEVTIPATLKSLGYATGHFGKWHLGSPNPAYTGKNSGNPAYPQWYGYDEHFVTAYAVPLWDPFGPSGEDAATNVNPYWHNGDRVLDNITGDDSRIIMDRVVPFIQTAVAAAEPFFAAVWFHTPHAEVVAGPSYRAMYSGYSDKEQDYYGAVTAMDEQVGRLRSELASLGVENDTMIWFCSDNGPENNHPGVTGGLRGRKRSLFNGGVNVPAFLRWPGHATPGRVTDMFASTLDYLPTIFDVLDYDMPDSRPIDGISLLPMIEGGADTRPKSVPFRFFNKYNSMAGAPTISLISGKYKFLTNMSSTAHEDMLFDLDTDRLEENNIVDTYPSVAARMKQELREFLESAKASHAGADYGDPAYEPVNSWIEVTGEWSDGDPTAPEDPETGPLLEGTPAVGALGVGATFVTLGGITLWRKNRT